MKRALVAPLLTALLTGMPAILLGQTAINRNDVVGTWELQSQRNVKTGVVDSVTKHRTAWAYFTPTRVLYVSQEKNRPRVSAADYAKLAPAEKQKANYARVWNEKNESQFSALGLKYRVEGNAFVYTQVLVLNPASEGIVFKETVTQPDKNTMLLRSTPDAAGESREETWKRVID